MAVKVLIVDDHRIVRAGIRLFLEDQEDIAVVGEAGNGEEAAALAATLHPDVVILDITMPQVSGLEAIRVIKAAAPDIHVLMLTMHDNERFFAEALAGGAEGYILKGADPEELLDAIRAVARGEAYLNPDQVRQVLAQYRSWAGREPHAAPGLAALSPREHEVLTLIADGRTGKEIAGRLSLSLNTVERHCANIMKKLGLHRRAELIRFALEEQMTLKP
jgi:two-component system, NarL family, response regulator NreC